MYSHFEGLERRAYMSFQLNQVAGFGGNTYDVAAEGSTAYVCQGNTLQVLDVSAPSTPQVIGQVMLGTKGSAVAVSGREVFIAEQTGHLLIVDCANPASPRIVGDCKGIWGAGTVAVEGRHAYVGGTQAVYVVDISDAASPTIQSSLALKGDPVDIAVRNGQLCVLSGFTGLSVIDASNPTSPALLGFYTSSGVQCEGVAVSGSYAFVASSILGIVTIDISNPSSPSLVASNSALSSRSIRIVGTTAYLAGGDAGAAVADISNPLSIHIEGHTSGTGRMAIAGKTLFLAEGEAGLSIIDVSNPMSPSISQSFGSAGTTRTIQVVGSHAYLADWGFDILDVSDPAKPVFEGRYRLTYAYTHLAATEGYVYLGYGQAQTLVIDVRDPAHPQKIGTIDTPKLNVSSLHIIGHDLVLSGSEGLQVVDISDPASPTLVTPLLNLPDINVVDGNRGYAYTTAGLSIVDFTDPSKPVILSTRSLPGYGGDVCIEGNLAFLEQLSHGAATVCDITDPKQPLIIGGTNGTSDGPSMVIGNYGYTSTGYVKRIDEIISPLTIPVSSNTAHPDTIERIGNYLYVPTFALGLVVYQLPSGGVAPDVDLVGTPGVASYTPDAVCVSIGQPIGTKVGTLSSYDVNETASFTYELAPGDGDQGNALFRISGNELQTATVLQGTPGSIESVRIRVTNQHSLSSEKVFSIGLEAAGSEQSVWGTDASDVIDVRRTAGGVCVFTNDPTHGSPLSNRVLVIRGLKGADRITIDRDVSLPCIIYGDQGADIIRAGGGPATIYGGRGHDLIFGGPGDDSLAGGMGNDTIWGGPGNDTIRGGVGNDELHGGKGDDVIFGGDGNNTLCGGRGSDWLGGGAGDDVIYARDSERDTIDGGAGDDIAHVDRLLDVITDVESVLG